MFSSILTLQFTTQLKVVLILINLSNKPEIIMQFNRMLQLLKLKILFLNFFFKLLKEIENCFTKRFYHTILSL